MAVVRNIAREKLEAGQLALGVGIRMTRSVEIAKAMAVCRVRLAVPRHGARRHVA
jgi:hypothetical protein